MTPSTLSLSLNAISWSVYRLNRRIIDPFENRQAEPRANFTISVNFTRSKFRGGVDDFCFLFPEISSLSIRSRTVLSLRVNIREPFSASLHNFTATRSRTESCKYYPLAVRTIGKSTPRKFNARMSSVFRNVSRRRLNFLGRGGGEYRKYTAIGFAARSRIHVRWYVEQGYYIYASKFNCINALLVLSFSESFVGRLKIQLIYFPSCLLSFLKHEYHVSEQYHRRITNCLI